MYGWGIGDATPIVPAVTSSPATYNMGEYSIFAAGGGILLGIVGLSSKNSGLAVVGFGIAAVGAFMFLQGASTVH